MPPKHAETLWREALARAVQQFEPSDVLVIPSCPMPRRQQPVQIPEPDDVFVIEDGCDATDHLSVEDLLAIARERVAIATQKRFKIYDPGRAAVA